MSRKSLKTRGAEGLGQVHAAQCVCLLTLPGLLIRGAPTRSHNSKVAGDTLPAPIDPFGIDDFDGDLAPDLKNYGIPFGFGKRRSICLTAHWGDVRIVARDVNGDRIPDPILSSAWTEETYAVLVNNGHDALSTVEPSSVQALHRKSTQRLSRARPQSSETAATSPRSAERGFAKAKSIGHSRPKGFVHRPDSVSVRCPLLVSLPGHAPPPPVLPLDSTVSVKTRRSSTSFGVTVLSRRIAFSN